MASDSCFVDSCVVVPGRSATALSSCSSQFQACDQKPRFCGRCHTSIRAAGCKCKPFTVDSYSDKYSLQALTGLEAKTWTFSSSTHGRELLHQSKSFFTNTRSLKEHSFLTSSKNSRLEHAVATIKTVSETSEDGDVTAELDSELNSILARPVYDPLSLKPMDLAGLRAPDNAKRIVLTWEEVADTADKLIRMIKTDLKGEPARRAYDVIVAITRGGMVPGCLISEGLGIRQVQTACVMFYTGHGAGLTLDTPSILQFPNDAFFGGQRVLLVDDVWDSGATCTAVKERLLRAGASKVTTAVLHFKPDENRFPGTFPDFYAGTVKDDTWLIYPWETDAREELGLKPL